MMLGRDYATEFHTSRPTRAGALLVHAAVAAIVGIVSAIGGGAVALHLAAAPPAGPFLPRFARAAAQAVNATAPVQTSVLIADPMPSLTQAGAVDVPAIVSNAAAANAAISLAAPPSQPLTERELTFAWGYAQRHPGGPSPQAEARAPASLASARPRAPKNASRHTAERQRATVAQRGPFGPSPSGVFQGFDGDSRRTLGNWASDRRMNVSFSTERNRPGRASALPNARNHENTRS